MLIILYFGHHPSLLKRRGSVFEVWKRKAKKCAATGSMLISTGLGARGVGRKGATLLQSGKQAAKLARAAQRAAASTAAATARLTNGVDVDSSFKVRTASVSTSWFFVSKNLFIYLQNLEKNFF